MSLKSFNQLGFPKLGQSSEPELTQFNFLAYLAKCQLLSIIGKVAVRAGSEEGKTETLTYKPTNHFDRGRGKSD